MGLPVSGKILKVIISRSETPSPRKIRLREHTNVYTIKTIISKCLIKLYSTFLVSYKLTVIRSKNHKLATV